MDRRRISILGKQEIKKIKYRETFYTADWADLWFEHHKYNISETTQENYSYTLRILKSEFGRRWVSSAFGTGHSDPKLPDGQHVPDSWVTVRINGLQKD